MALPTPEWEEGVNSCALRIFQNACMAMGLQCFNGAATDPIKNGAIIARCRALHSLVNNWESELRGPQHGA